MSRHMLSEPTLTYLIKGYTRLFFSRKNPFCLLFFESVMHYVKMPTRLLKLKEKSSLEVYSNYPFIRDLRAWKHTQNGCIFDIGLIAAQFLHPAERFMTCSVDEFPTWHGKTTSKVWLFSHDCNQIFSYFGIF